MNHLRKDASKKLRSILKEDIKRSINNGQRKREYFTKGMNSRINSIEKNFRTNEIDGIRCSLGIEN
jgi:hypothetical protein